MLLPSLYHKRCTSCGGQEDEDLDLGDQKRRRRRRRREPGKGRLETRLDLVKVRLVVVIMMMVMMMMQEDMIADLVRLLGSGTVDTNTVANYFLAQQLLAALATIKEETTQTILAKVQSGIHRDHQADISWDLLTDPIPSSVY